MDAVKKVLSVWIQEYLRHKDMFQRKIKKIVDGNPPTVVYSDKETKILVEPVITNIDDIRESCSDGSVILVTLNMMKNLKMIADNWSKLISNPDFCIYFVNPVGAAEKRWVIFPYTHNKIAERSSLKSGLKSLFSTVAEVSEKDIKKIRKSV